MQCIITTHSGVFHDSNQGNLGSEDMKEFVYIPLPPIEEQHRIVAKIEELLPY